MVKSIITEYHIRLNIVVAKNGGGGLTAWWCVGVPMALLRVRLGLQVSSHQPLMLLHTAHRWLTSYRRSSEWPHSE